MRVLHVIPTMSRNDGGPTSAVVRMAEALAKRGVDVTVVTTHSRWSADEHPDGILERFSASVPAFTFPAWPLIQPRGFSPRMLQWLSQNVQSFDLVHLHSMFNWHSLAVPRVCSSRGVPFVIRPLGTLDPWARAQKAWKKRPYFELVEKSNLREAARVHVTSDAELQSVSALGFAAKARCIPIGIDLPTLNRVHREASQGLRILFLSRFHPGKNLPILLRAFRDASFAQPAVLVVAGDGEPRYVAEMHALATELGIGERVRFLGFVEGEAKDRLYRESDVFALPSAHESFGIAVAEAMAYGLPVVIGAGVALAPRVAAAGAGQILTELSSTELARALVVYEDAASRSKASAAARDLVAVELSTDAMARGLLEMYSECRPQQA